jgi:hypothetical protein
MDTSKKHLYFNPTTDSVAAAVSCPVSGFLGMEVTSTSNLIMYFREGHDSDTLDITLTRSTTGDDPKLVIEEIVNAINFSKESTVVVADNFTGDYLTPKIQEISSLNDGFVIPLLFQRPTTFLVSEGSDGVPTDPGDGFDTGTYSFNTGSVGMINGEVITTIFFDMQALALTNASTAAKVIGKGSATANASITKITEAKNGVVYGAEIICVETPGGAGTTTDLDIIATTDDLTTDEAVSGDNLLIAGNAISKGDVIRSAEGVAQTFAGLNNHFVYLSTGNAQGTTGTYDAGKFILRLFGAPTVNLNDIS